MIRRLRPTERPTPVMLFTNSIAIGGMEEHVRLLAEHIDRTSFTVVSVVPCDHSFAAFNEVLRRTSDEFATITPDRRFGLLQSIRGVAQLIRYVRAQRIGVAHLHSTDYSGLWQATLSCWLAGVRRVYVTEHLAPYGPVTRWRAVERRLFGLATTRIIAVSEKNREHRASHLHTAPDATVVVTNGIDVSRFQNISEIDIDAVRNEAELGDCVVVGTVVRLEPGKGVADLIDAFAIVVNRHPSTKLLLVGDGSLRTELDAQVDRVGVRERTVFTGFQSDPRPFLAAMDVFVLPVPAGSASIGLLEAMAMGLPAIITFGGPGEAVEPGLNGWWATPDDPVDLAERICALVADSTERKAMGAAARERVLADFSAARVARQLEQLYRFDD